MLRYTGTTVFSRTSAPVKASIYGVDILAFTGGACPGEYGITIPYYFKHYMYLHSISNVFFFSAIRPANDGQPQQGGPPPPPTDSSSQGGMEIFPFTVSSLHSQFSHPNTLSDSYSHALPLTLTRGVARGGHRGPVPPPLPSARVGENFSIF